MPKIAYKDCNFRNATLALINQCNDIIAEYQADGLKLTLRQLYYQLVSRDIIANSVKEYNKLGCTVNDGRLAGLIDWDAIEDRTRNLESVGHFIDPASIMSAAANSYRIDKWANQPYRAEVWIEKEALAGVFERVCEGLDVPYLSCRGYTSQSEMWAAAMRFVGYVKRGQRVHIFHFGDHDPSGIDMTRDIEDRIRMFMQRHVGITGVRNFELTRVALNMDQVKQYDPPENPAKSSDTRFQAYLDKFGESSWELDALNPRVLAALVRNSVEGIRSDDAWQKMCRDEAEGRAKIGVASDEWALLNEHIETWFEEELAARLKEELAKYNLDGEAE